MGVAIAANREELWAPMGLSMGLLETLETVAGHHRHACPAVVEKSCQVLRLEVGIDHHDHSSELQSAKQGPDEIRAIPQGNQNALLLTDPEIPQYPAKPIGQVLDLGIGEHPVIESQGHTIATALINAGVQKPMRDIQLDGELAAHIVSRGSFEESSATQ
jgi:hypothetical protein